MELLNLKVLIRYSIPPKWESGSIVIIPPNKVIFIPKSIILKPKALSFKPHAIKPTNKLNITIVVIVHL